MTTENKSKKVVAKRSATKKVELKDQPVGYQEITEENGLRTTKTVLPLGSVAVKVEVI